MIRNTSQITTYRGSVLLALIGLLLMVSQQAMAVTTFTDLASWNLAHGETTVLEDFESAGTDILFGNTEGNPISFNDLRLESNAGPTPELANALIDFDDVGDGSGYRSSNSGPNGGTVVNMRFLNFADDTPSTAPVPEYVEMTLPLGTRAFSFSYNNYDSSGDLTELSIDGVTVGAFTGGTGFFGVVGDPGVPMSKVRFTAKEALGGSSGITTFNSFDDVQYNTPDVLTLSINTTTGATEILNDTVTPFDINYYRITSSSEDLNVAGWNSFSDQVLDPTDGPDLGSALGNGIGETWDEAGGSDSGVLSELFLLGSSAFDGRTESLGNAFVPGGDTSLDSLTFEYQQADTEEVFTGNIVFVGGGIGADFDNNGIVDGDDFLRWQRGLGLTNQANNSTGDADGNGTVDGLDLAIWRAQFGGAPVVVAAASATTVPEPTTIGLLALAIGNTMFVRRRR